MDIWEFSNHSFPESSPHLAGSFPEDQKARRTLREVFRKTRKLPARCRNFSGDQESLLHPATNFPESRKPSCTLATGFLDKNANNVKKI